MTNPSSNTGTRSAAFCLSDVRFAPAPPHDAFRGVVGWASCTINGTVRLDGIAVRRTRGGRLAVSFPVRVDGRGRRHSVVRPLDDRARRMIEREIIAELGMEDLTKK